MDIHQLDHVLHEPTEDHGWMYWAEIPALPGCAAWGDTPEQTLDDLGGQRQDIHRNAQGGREAPSSGAYPLTRPLQKG